MMSRMRRAWHYQIPHPVFNAGACVLITVGVTIDAAGWAIVDRHAAVRAGAVVVAAITAWRARGPVDQFRSWRRER